MENVFSIASTSTRYRKTYIYEPYIYISKNLKFGRNSDTHRWFLLSRYLRIEAVYRILYLNGALACSKTAMGLQASTRTRHNHLASSNPSNMPTYFSDMTFLELAAFLICLYTIWVIAVYHWAWYAFSPLRSSRVTIQVLSSSEPASSSRPQYRVPLPMPKTSVGSAKVSRGISREDGSVYSWSTVRKHCCYLWEMWHGGRPDAQAAVTECIVLSIDGVKERTWWVHQSSKNPILKSHI